MSDFLSGEAAIYPGHPLTVAYLIINAYHSLAAASRKSDHDAYPAALVNGNIPGAGRNVWAALDFLHKVMIEHVPIDDAIAHANAIWARCDDQAAGGNYAKSTTEYARFVGRWRDGQTQADQIVGKLRQQLERWR